MLQMIQSGGDGLIIAFCRGAVLKEPGGVAACAAAEIEF